MTFEDVVGNIIIATQGIIYVIMALGLTVFLFGLVGYLSNVSDEEKRKESIDYMINGIIGLFVMVSVWGLLAILTGTFDISLRMPQLR